MINTISHIFGNKIDTVFRIINMLTSLLVIGAIVVDYGFVLDEHEMSIISRIYNFGWWVYFLSFTFQLPFHWKQIRRKRLLLTTILGVILYTSAFTQFFEKPENTIWLINLWNFLENKYFLATLLGLISIIELSRGITHFINRKTNPALIVVACFAAIIAFGTLLLMLPRSTMEHIRLPIIDALFTATSAVCVTGLSTVEISQTFTIEGQIIIALLIQIGGLGIMTITSFFALFFMDGMGLYSQFSVKDMLSSRAESLMSTLVNVLGFTIVIELVGAFCIWMSIHPVATMTIKDGFFFSVFHSISAFCNAGFSTLEGNLGNDLIFANHNSFYIIISILIVLGGLGFPILINLKKMIKYYFGVLSHKVFKRKRYTRYNHLADANTKIVLYMSAILVFFGAFLIGIIEWNGAFADLPIDEKIVQSLFNAIVPRTAGFNSVAVSEFSRITILLIIILMWIGGASQSTAGGIKVNTFAVALASLKALVRGRQETELFNREITYNSIRRTLVIIFGSILIITIFFVWLLLLEPTMSSMDILFETISAFSTVGLSLGVTAQFCGVSKFLLIILMFIGRVGFIIVLMSIVSRKENVKYRLPKEDIIIN